MKLAFWRKIPTTAPIRAVPAETWKLMQESQLFLVAGSLAYTTILSIIPLLAVSLSLFKAFGGMEKLYDTIEPYIVENLARSSGEQAIAAIRGSIANVHAGTLGATGLVGLVITCMSMLSSAEAAIHRVWKADNKRPLFQRLASYWLFITLGPVGLSFALSLVTSQSIPFSKVLPGGTLLFVLTVGVFFTVYKWVPNRKVFWKPALAGAVMTAIVWNLARVAYQVYTREAVSTHAIYGSLSAIPILLLWIYILWLIVLTGASLTAALQKRIDLLRT
jgi:membrane protein